MEKIKVTLNGEVHEVEQSALELGNMQLVDPEKPPKGLFNQAGVDQVVQQAKQGLKSPNSLLQDPDHQKTVLSNFGITLDNEGNPVGVKQGDDKEKFQQWFEKHAKPLESELEKSKQMIQSYEQKVVGEAVSNRISKYLDPKVADNPFMTKGLKSQFKFDAESSQVIPVDEAGQPIRHGNGSLMNIDEYFETETKAGQLKSLARDDRQTSSNFQRSKGQEEQKTYTRTQFDSLPEIEKHKAIKEGAKVVD